MKTRLLPIMIFLLISLLLIVGVQIPSVHATAEEDFESLFFGTGAWLGLLLFMIVCVALVAISKYTVVFVVIIVIMMEVEYYARLDIYGNYVWHMIILMFFALFMCIASLTGKLDRKK